MSAKLYKIKNRNTDEEIVENSQIVHLPLEVVYDYQVIKKVFTRPDFQSQPLNHSKYSLLYPIIDINGFSLLEGATPLYKSESLKADLNLKQLYFKNEGNNPTGSFKDRGSLVEVAKAREYNAQAVILASTGNMAASVAAYCAKIQMPCFVFVPEATSPNKLAQAKFYGAKIIKIIGDYTQTELITKKTASEFNLFLSGDYAFRTEGQKSQAYEIIEQLKYHIPDYVLVSVGCGTNIYAIFKGFYEYFQMGLINKIPKFIAIEVKPYDAIVEAYNNKQSLAEAVALRGKANNFPSTVATAIAVRNPLDGDKVLDLLKQTHGEAVSVDDQETFKAQAELASKEGIFVEPSSATVYAALKKLIKSKVISHESEVVCVLTGHGLKDSTSNLHHFPESNTIKADLNEVKELFEKEKWLK